MKKVPSTSSHYTQEELNSLRKLAPRSRSDIFLCEEYSEHFSNKGITLSIRLDYRLIHETVSFPDCATWRIAAFNLETASYCHCGFTGTFAELLQKTSEDLQRVAGCYGPAARETIMRSVFDIENLLHGGSGCGSSASPNNDSDETKQIIFRIRDPSGLSRTTILRPQCMTILTDLRIKDVKKLWNEKQHNLNNNNKNKNNNNQNQDEEEQFDFQTCYNEVASKLLPIYLRTYYDRSWEEDKELGIFTYDNISPITPIGQPFTTAEEIAELVKKSKNIVLLSGAGISVESGIKPFRTSTKDGQAIWKDFDANKMTVDNFNSDHDIVRAWWDMKRNLYRDFIRAKPNAAHTFFGTLHKMGKLRGVITQNIDSLHLAGGVPKEKLVELHGHMRVLTCSDNQNEHNTVPIMQGKCDFEMDEPFLKDPSLLEDVKRLNEDFLNVFQEKQGNDDADDGESGNSNAEWLHLHSHVPLCKKCQAPLRTPTIMFGQNLPSSQWEKARRLIGSKNNNNKNNNDDESEDDDDDDDSKKTSCCDLLFVVGTSLIVAPANDLPGQCLRNGIPVVMINMDATMYDQYATGLVHEPAGQFLAQVEKLL